jgi:hypothetical protein
MKIRTVHGRKGTGTEYYEWQFRMPAIFVQRVGEQWLFGINHTDKTLQTLAYYPNLDVARRAADRLAWQYAGTRFTNLSDERIVEEQRRIAQEVIEDEADKDRCRMIVDHTGHIYS